MGAPVRKLLVGFFGALLAPVVIDACKEVERSKHGTCVKAID
jgi:hypothetical protein